MLTCQLVLSACAKVNNNHLGGAGHLLPEAPNKQLQPGTHSPLSPVLWGNSHLQALN